MGLVFRGKLKATQKQLAAKTGTGRRYHAGKTVLAVALASPTIANDLVPELTIKRITLDRLKPAKKRPRKAGKDHVANVAKCIKAVGQVSPILVDSDDRIVDGHIVVEALKLLGEDRVNAVCLDHLNEDQLKLIQISINKLSEGSVWELDELRPMLHELQLVGYDLTVTGFTLPELDIIKQSEPNGVPGEAKELLEPPSDPVSVQGDLWILDKHRLLCGDALDERSYATVLGLHKADASFTDCPWNLPAKTISSKHGDFKMGAGEMGEETFQDFVDTFTQQIANHLEEGAVLFSCIDWRSHDKIVLGGKRAGLTHINTAVWNKGSGGMGGLYRSAHELIPLFSKGKGPKTNNVALGKHGRDRSNVFTYPGANTPGSSAAKALKHHPTPKPVELVEDVLLDVTNFGDLVLDPFMGSGTTILAAERCGRVAAGIELNEAFVDVCIRRWQEMTGKVAIHAETQRSFDEIAAIRGGEEMSNEGAGNDDQ